MNSKPRATRRPSRSSEASAESSTSGGSARNAGAASDLALGKTNTASTQQPANPSTRGKDGHTTTRWRAATATLPQWSRLDLGASHTLSQLSVQWKFADRKDAYAVETSSDDSAHTTQANVSAHRYHTSRAIPNHAVRALRSHHVHGHSLGCRSDDRCLPADSSVHCGVFAGAFEHSAVLASGRGRRAASRSPWPRLEEN